MTNPPKKMKKGKAPECICGMDVITGAVIVAALGIAAGSIGTATFSVLLESPEKVKDFARAYLATDVDGALENCNCTAAEKDRIVRDAEWDVEWKATHTLPFNFRLCLLASVVWAAVNAALLRGVLRFSPDLIKLWMFAVGGAVLLSLCAPSFVCFIAFIQGELTWLVFGKCVLANVVAVANGLLVAAPFSIVAQALFFVDPDAFESAEPEGAAGPSKV